MYAQKYSSYTEYIQAEKAYYAELEREYYKELENSQDISKAANENNS